MPCAFPLATMRRLCQPACIVTRGGGICIPVPLRKVPAMRIAVRLVLLIAVACAAPLAQADTLRIGILADPATLDPAQSSSVTDRVVFAGFCDKLIDLDDKLHYVPQLATA